MTPKHLARRSRKVRLRYVAVAAVVVLVALAAVVVVRRDDDRPSPVATASDVGTTATSSASAEPDPSSSIVPSAPSTSTTPPDATFTLVAVGDTMLGKEGSLPPSPSTYFDLVKSDLTQDAQVVFGNLEGTFTTASGGKCAGSTSGNCFAFKDPPSFAQAFAGAGFTILNNANNHFHDYGQAGADETLAAIKSAGMVQTGLPGQVTVVQAGPLRVGFVGFGPYDGMASLLDIPAARDLIHKARTMADVVVVYMHAGAEGATAQHVTGKEEIYVDEDRGNPQAFAHMAIDEGAGLVIGSGPHVLRGMEVYKGHLVAYSLGNFAGFGNFNTDGVLANSGILRVTLDGTGAVRAGRLVPVKLSSKGQPSPGGSSVAMVSKLSEDDFGSSAPSFAADGTLSLPG